jgi:hypothetical protein
MNPPENFMCIVALVPACRETLVVDWRWCSIIPGCDPLPRVASGLMGFSETFVHAAAEFRLK